MEKKTLLQLVEEMVEQYVKLNARAPKEIRVNPKVLDRMDYERTREFLKLDEPKKENRDRLDIMSDLIDAKVRMDIWKKETEERMKWEKYYVRGGKRIPFVEDEQEDFIHVC